MDSIYEESFKFAHKVLVLCMTAGVYAGNMNKCVSTSSRIAGK